MNEYEERGTILNYDSKQGRNRFEYPFYRVDDKKDKKDNKDNKDNKISDQQFFPGGTPTPPRPPAMDGAPRSAPPSFTPEMPEEDRQLLGEPARFGAQPRGGFRPRPPMNMRRCLNRFTYVWLINGTNFWFFPIRVGFQQVEGFRWRRNGWVYERINMRRVFTFRCF